MRSRAGIAPSRKARILTRGLQFSAAAESPASESYSDPNRQPSFDTSNHETAVPNQLALDLGLFDAFKINAQGPSPNCSTRVPSHDRPSTGAARMTGVPSNHASRSRKLVSACCSVRANHTSFSTVRLHVP